MIWLLILEWIVIVLASYGLTGIVLCFLVCLTWNARKGTPEPALYISGWPIVIALYLWSNLTEWMVHLAMRERKSIAQPRKVSILNKFRI